VSVRDQLIELPPEHCASLLASSTLGRVGVVVDGLPEIFPVNHVYDSESGCVVFPTGPGTKLYAARNSSGVAFEVDSVDPDGDGGWSVLVVGKAQVVTDSDAVARLARERHVRWGTEDALTWVRIVPFKVTGRRIDVARSSTR
jgi:nitroimidazol reductase NimA-like FMN-containing flavoprotein (pyridoxamine 5'-phosphate oxidase superfamily)